MLDIATEGLTGGGATAKFEIIMFDGLDLSLLSPNFLSYSSVMLSNIFLAYSGHNFCFLSEYLSSSRSSFTSKSMRKAARL